MISTRFAGLGDVKRPGLSVVAATQRLLCLAYVEKRLMFLCAAKMVSVPERDLKLVLGRLQHLAAGRCHSLRSRLREMRTAKVRIDGLVNEALAIFLDEASYGDESSEVARIVLVDPPRASRGLRRLSRDHQSAGRCADLRIDRDLSSSTARYGRLSR